MKNIEIIEKVGSMENIKSPKNTVSMANAEIMGNDRKKNGRRSRGSRRIGALLAAVLMIMGLPSYSFGATENEAAETITKNVAFSGLNSKEIIKSVEFSESWFSESADSYNHGLAQFSAALCAAADGKTQTNIEKAFSGFGFTNDEVYDKESYNRDYSVNNDVVGYSFASKNIPANGKMHTLIAVAVRSTRNAEWYSNFNINDDGSGTKYHRGFAKAEEELMINLSSYVQSLNIEPDETIILVTGHSRGGGIANILAGELSGSEKLADRENIYGYTFAAPNAVVSDSINYSNIFNVVNPSDFVANLPLSRWGYWKYGSTYALPCEEDEGYNSLLIKAGNEFYALTGMEYEPLSLTETSAFLDDIYGLAPTVKDCYSRKIAYNSGTVTMKKYFDTLAGLLAEGKGLGSFLQYSSGQLSTLTAYFATNQLMGSGIKDSHAIETYISWLAVTDEAQLEKDVFTVIVAPTKKVDSDTDIDIEATLAPIPEREYDFYRDCYAVFRPAKEAGVSI